MTVYKLDIVQATLENAGSCTRMETIGIEDGGMPADILVIYVIPAPGGSLIATEHFVSEASEGFGRDFEIIMNSMSVIGAN